MITEAEKEELLAYLTEDFAENDRLDAWIKMAEFRVSREYFGKAYIYALSLMVCHKGALENRGINAAAGNISSMREGELSVSYSTGSSSGDGDISSTSYGMEYLSLLKQYGARPRVTGGLNIGAFAHGNAV